MSRLHLSDVFRYVQQFGQKGHQIGRKIGDAIELITYGMIDQNDELKKYLVVEEKLEGVSGAKHKVEFSFYDLEKASIVKETLKKRRGGRKEGLLSQSVESKGHTKEEFKGEEKELKLNYSKGNAQDALIPAIHDIEKLFGFIECKKVGVEQTIKSNFKNWKYRNSDFPSTEGYKFKIVPGKDQSILIEIKDCSKDFPTLKVTVTHNVKKIQDIHSENTEKDSSANEEEAATADVQLMQQVHDEKKGIIEIKNDITEQKSIKIKKVAKKIKNLKYASSVREYFFRVKLNDVISFSIDLNGTFHILAPDELLSDVDTAIQSCVILHVTNISNGKISKVNVEECLPGPQTPEKAKQASFVALDVRKRILGTFDKTDDNSKLNAILVIGEFSHWEEKSRAMVRLCNDNVLIIPDNVVIDFFKIFHKELGDNYQRVITKKDYEKNSKVRDCVTELIAKYKGKILKEMDSDKFVIPNIIFNKDNKPSLVLEEVVEKQELPK